MRTTAMVAVAVVCTAAASAQARPASSDGHGAAVRRMATAFYTEVASRPAAACRRYLTARARREYNRGTQSPDCADERAGGVQDRFRVRVVVASSERRARVKYQLLIRHPMCGERHVPERVDIAVRTRGAWRIDDFGFGAIRCVPR